MEGAGVSLSREIEVHYEPGVIEDAFGICLQRFVLVNVTYQRHSSR